MERRPAPATASKRNWSAVDISLRPPTDVLGPGRPAKFTVDVAVYVTDMFVGIFKEKKHFLGSKDSCKKVQMLSSVEPRLNYQVFISNDQVSLRPEFANRRKVCPFLTRSCQ